MSTYAYSGLHGHGHNYNKMEYQKTRADEEKDHASYAAIMEYSQIQEKLLLNLRHQLEKIRGADHRDIQQTTPKFVEVDHSRSNSPSVTAFKNAAIAARRLPIVNSRNKHGKQITPTILNPKRDYPRPWAMDKVVEQTSNMIAEHNNASNFNVCNNSSFQQQCKTNGVNNPQKQYYSSAVERHLPLNCDFSHQQYPFQHVCRNCQIPMIHDPEAYLADQETSPYGQCATGSTIVPNIKASVLPTERMTNCGTWNNNYYLTEGLLNENNNSQFNSVVFPDPQAKKHPYLMKILKNTITGNCNVCYNKKPASGLSTSPKYLKAISQGSETGSCGPVKVFNPLANQKQNSSKSQISKCWGSNKILNNHPSVSVNVKVEESISGGQKPQLVTKISSSISIGQTEKSREMTLLSPRCILSSLSPAWSQTSLKEKTVLKRRPNNKDESSSATDSETDIEKSKKENRLVKQERISVNTERAVTYQVFPDNKKVLSEWEGIEHEVETNAEGYQSIKENHQEKKVQCSRNALSSGDESYGSMKVIRDSKEDFVKRIYEDFQSYEDLYIDLDTDDKKVEIKKPRTSKRKTKTGHDGDKPTIFNTEPQVLVAKAKDSKSLLRSRRLSFYKKKDGSRASSRKTSALKLPIVKKSVSCTSQIITQNNASPYERRMWRPLIVEKMFPEVEKVLQEAKGLSPYVGNLDKLFESPPDLEKLIDDKPWAANKLTRFPTWFRDVDPITKLGEHLTINKVFQIDIKPGQFKCSPLEEFVTESVGVFRGSNSTVHDSTSNIKEIVRKTTTELVAEVKNAEMGDNFLDSEAESIRPLTTAKVSVTPVKKEKILCTTGQLLDVISPSNADILNKAKCLADKAAIAIGLQTDTDINANIEVANGNVHCGKGEEKTLTVAHTLLKSNFPVTVTAQKNCTIVKDKSHGKVIGPSQRLKMTPEETTIVEKTGGDYSKLDRRHLKLLMDNPDLYTNLDGKVNMDKLLNEVKADKEMSNRLSGEKGPKDKKAVFSDSFKNGNSSNTRKKSKGPQPKLKHTMIKQ